MSLRLSWSCLALPRSALCAWGWVRVVVRGRWCRAGVRPGGGCAGLRRGCPLLRFSVISSGGRCAWVRASPQGVASAPAWLCPAGGGGSGAARLIVGGAAASACPPAGACLCGFGRACRSTMAAGLPSSSPSGAALPRAHGSTAGAVSRSPVSPAPRRFRSSRPAGLGAGGWAFVFVALLGRGVSLLGLTPTPCRYAVGLGFKLGDVRRVPRASPLPPPSEGSAVLGLFLGWARLSRL